MVPTIHHTEYPWWYFHCTTDMSTSYVGYILPLQNIPRLSKRFRHYENTFTRSNLQLNYQFQLIPLIYYIPTLMIFLKKPTSIPNKTSHVPPYKEYLLRTPSFSKSRISLKLMILHNNPIHFHINDTNSLAFCRLL